MAGLREALSNSLTSTACTLLGAGSTFASNFENLISAIAPDTFFPRVSTAAGLSAAYSLFCDRPAPSLIGPPPFTGGQCAAGYRVYYSGSRQYDGGVSGAPFTTPFTGYGDVTGPVSGLGQEESGGSVNMFIDANPNVIVESISGISAPDVGKFRFIGLTITSIVRIDGLGSDSCGDPPGTPVLPNDDPIQDNVDITYVNNEGDNVTNNFDFTFSPAFIDFNGNLNVPVHITNNDDPDFIQNVHLNLNTGDINFYAGNPATPPGSSGNPAAPSKPGTNLPDYPTDLPAVDPIPFSDDDPPQEQEIIKGAVVTVHAISARTTILYQSSNPNILVPNVGYISFLIDVGGATAWTADIPVKNKRQLIPCDWFAGAIDVRGTPQPGVSWTITPIYVAQTVE